jgi:hypothetical protein
LQLAHVVADPGEPLEAALAIQEILHGGRAHLLLLQQIEDYAGVDLAWPRTHGQTVKRGKAHGALDAASAGERAHGGAATQMSDNNAPRHGLGDLRQAGRDVFIREAMKAVAAHSFRVQVLRDGKMVCNRRMTAVEGGIEAGNLGELWKKRANGANRREIVWLVQGRKRHILIKPYEHLLGYQDWFVVLGAAMHDAVPHRAWRRTLLFPQPCTN